MIRIKYDDTAYRTAFFDAYHNKEKLTSRADFIGNLGGKYIYDGTTKYVEFETEEDAIIYRLKTCGSG